MGNHGFGEVSWSASRARLYEVCPRRFYYRYASREFDSAASYSGDESTVDHPGAKVQYLTKHPRLAVSAARVLCRSGCTDGLDERITDGSTESCRCRRRSAADATASPPPAGLLGRWLAVESVVRWPIRGDGPTHREGRPRSSSNHIDELLVRPPPEATPASAGVATYRSEGTARRSVRGDSPPRTAAVPLIRVVVVAIACSNKR